MREFWDERAEEDAFFFVDNELSYGDPDLERFWARGTEVVDSMLAITGAEIRPQDRVVEIGCGVGRITRELARRAAHVDALDVSARMLELAKEHNGEIANVRWLLGDGESLQGVEDASADACFSHVVFQHVPSASITLSYVREMGRVLRPGGWSAFQISNSQGIHRRRSLRERSLATLRAALRRGPRGQSHPAWLGSAVDIGDLRTVAGEGDMSIESLTGEGTQFCFVLLRKAG